MTDPQNVHSATPIGQLAATETSRFEKHTATTAVPDPELLAILAKVQNNCFAEMGYYPTLLQEFRELQKQCALLRADNQKLYADNRSLAQFVAAQDQRVKLLQNPVDQQKRAITDLHEHVRILTTERDEIAGRLHAALNEIVVLRQELGRFVPNAMVMSPLERASPSGASPQLSRQPHQRAVSYAAPYGQMQSSAQGNVPAAFTHAQRGSQYKPEASNMRPVHPQQVPRPPQHRGSLPAVMPIDTSVPPPNIAQHRRPSAPPSLSSRLPAPGQSPISPSPVNGFSGLNLGSNPSTPISSQPGTVSGTKPIAPRQPSVSRSPSSRGFHVQPQVPVNPSSSSLAGAIIDLTKDNRLEDPSRKRRKLDHTPQEQSPQGMLLASPVSPAEHTVGRCTAPVQTIPSQASAAPSPHPPNHHPIAPTAVPAAPAEVYQNVAPEALEAPPPPPTYPPVQDTVMSEAAMEEQEEQTTIEEDCIEANFDEDDANESVLWCRMCRSRFKGGHTAEPPTPFVNAPQQVLIEHCEKIHPRGWEILKTKVAEQRAAEEAGI